MKLSTITIIFFASLCANQFGISSAEVKEDETSKATLESNNVSLNNKQLLEKDGKFWMPVKYHRLKTATQFAIITSTIFNFCISGTINTNGQLCTKRKKRSAPIADMTDDNIVNLESSRSEPSEFKKTDDTGKLVKWTIYSSTTSTLSVTVKSTDLASTISLSLACFNAGLSVPVICGK